MRVIFLLLVVLSITTSAFHPIYVSSTDIDYKSKEKRLEISIKIFSDDLQKVLSKVLKREIEINTNRESNDAETLILDYIKKHFVLYNGDKILDLEFVGRSQDKDDLFGMLVFFKVDKVKRLSNLRLYNSILVDDLAGQINTISFRKDRGAYLKFKTYESYREVVLVE